MSKNLKIFAILLLINITAAMAQNTQSSLQFALNTKQFKEVIKEQSNNSKKYLPVVLATGRRVSLDLKLTAFNERVLVVDNKENSELVRNEGHLPVELSSVFISETRASYLLFFKEAKIRIKLRKVNGKWTLKSFKTKNRKSYSWFF
ncbi:hypothetical protein [Tenacibaculum ovolyticum]|uniref:hypothetical protein n=1 Tax=Tenacibaculum ovolyticum TaxID=104270 RepID=UPI003BABDB8B